MLSNQFEKKLGVLSQWYCCCREEISLLHRPCCREGEIDVVVLEAVIYVVEDLDEGFGEGAAVDDGLLGAADFGGRDELHGFGDLLDVLHGVDSLPQFSEAATDSRWGSAKCGLDGGAGGDGGGENGQRIFFRWSFGEVLGWMGFWESLRIPTVLGVLMSF
ncbi:hypothetical protein TIFTF001_052692 [Ficus carica]|uniref:Uncharacterized protein n=1 Tax=Ficus carica TaxID=3494 RepID=A0AA88EEB3_FICCA|nr:hypothetical protein TIFTF001_052692 [Ficus carica]